MKLIKPYIEFLTKINREEILKQLEIIGRTCYKSEDKITEDSASKFVKMLVDRGHHAMIEHFTISVRVVCDRGVSHEIVRHRLASYAQESTRYVNYSKDKFGNELTFILPCWFQNNGEGIYEFINDNNDILCMDLNDMKSWNLINDGDFLDEELWLQQMIWSEKTYLKLINKNWTPQQARSVLPNALKTEIVMTMNLREWIHFFKMRCSKFAHPQMIEIANMIYNKMKKELPEIYGKLSIE